MEREIHTFDDARALFAAAADRVAEAIIAGAGERGAYHLVLAGGGTPTGIYRLLGEPPRRDRIPWPRVHVWFGDERTVPPDHDDSNYRMARETLLDQVAVPPSQIHRMEGERDPAEAAQAYGAELERWVPKDADGVPQFDLVLLGLGPDGHIASLFPGTDILERNDAWAAAVYVEKLDTWRLSLTLPILDHARYVMLIASGDEKADIVRNAVRNESAEPLPVQRIDPHGRHEWLLDRDAARYL